MPDLPTLTVTDEQATRMLAAFGSAAKYRAWLKDQIIQYVVNQEFISANEQFRSQQEATAEQTRTDLGG